MQTNEFYATALAVLVACSDSSLAAVNIIDQTYGVGAGSFELGPYSQNSGNSGNYMRLAANSTTMIGWTVGGPDGVDWERGPSNPGYDGIYGVDLAGISHSGASSSGSVTTTIPTAIGVDYTISFLSYILGPDPVTGILTAGTLNAEFSSVGINDPSNPTYTSFQYSFTALSTSTAITFATFNSGGFGPVIDNVIVAIPEPSSGLIGLSAILGFSLRRRRPQK